MDYSKFFPILEYYRRVVEPMNPRRYKMKGEKMMVCPLHNDHDPSMGIMLNKKRGEIFHCFGCGRWGDVVELNVGVRQRLQGIYMTYDESLRDLCRVFDVDYDSLPKPDINTDASKEIMQEIALTEAMERFDVSDYRELYLEGKRKKKSIAYFNTLTMIMVNEVKEDE